MKNINHIEDGFIWRRFYDKDAKLTRDEKLEFIIDHKTGMKLFPYFRGENVSGIVKFVNFRAGYAKGAYELRSV